ncbi:MAG: NAD-binding protein, partial [candidate division Zixibacteria bacterium]|nr:NAD-binding protein [candidate division Zixibacteria bacterium]
MDSNDRQSQGLTSTQKLRLALVMLALIIVAGTAGFMTLEEMKPIDALYMTVITLSTVGYGEISTLHPEGRIFVIFLIAFGVATAGYTFSVMGKTILEGQFKEMFGRRKMEGKINKMSGHIIIAGYGRVGRQVAEEFQKRKIPFVVIEKDEDAIVRLDRDGVMFVQGEATDDDVLHKAGIKRAKTLVSTLPSEANNVYLTLTARDINRNLHIISRAD